jgi:hypothetical protein
MKNQFLIMYEAGFDARDKQYVIYSVYPTYEKAHAIATLMQRTCMIVEVKAEFKTKLVVEEVK